MRTKLSITACLSTMLLLPAINLFGQTDPCADDPIWIYERAALEICDWFWGVEEEGRLYAQYNLFTDDTQAGYINNVIVADSTDSSLVIVGTDQQSNEVKGSLIVHRRRQLQDSVVGELSIFYNTLLLLHLKEVITPEGNMKAFITCPSDSARNIKIFTTDLSPGSPSGREKILRLEVTMLDTTITGAASLTMDRVPIVEELSRVKRQRFLGPAIKIPAFNETFICEIAEKAIPGGDLFIIKHKKEDYEQGKCVAMEASLFLGFVGSALGGLPIGILIALIDAWAVSEFYNQ